MASNKIDNTYQKVYAIYSKDLIYTPYILPTCDLHGNFFTTFFVN